MKTELTADQIMDVFTLHCSADDTLKKLSVPFLNADDPCVFVPANLANIFFQREFIRSGHAKLALVPMHEISLAHAIEVAAICDAFNNKENAHMLKLEYKMSGMPTPEPFAQLFWNYTPKTGPYKEKEIRNVVCNIDQHGVKPCSGNEYWSTLTMAFQYLILNGYDVPLYFEPGHVLNGKTAIELGLAIPRPDRPHITFTK